MEEERELREEEQEEKKIYVEKKHLVEREGRTDGRITLP